MVFAANDGLVGGLAGGLLIAAPAVIGIWISRRSASEANKTTSTLTEFQILSGTVSALHDEVDRLEHALDDANDKAERLNRELDAAQQNVRILANHIHRHLPEVPFPKLVRMNDVG